MAGATIAILPYCFPPTANQLTASIITDHPKAGIIEYAIGIIEPENRSETALDRDTALGFSDWIEVEPNVHWQITLDLPTSATQHCHIVISPRLVKGNRDILLGLTGSTSIRRSRRLKSINPKLSSHQSSTQHKLN